MSVLSKVDMGTETDELQGNIREMKPRVLSRTVLSTDQCTKTMDVAHALYPFTYAHILVRTNDLRN